MPFPFTGFTSDARQGRLLLVVHTRVVRLKRGDYSLAGLEVVVAVVRKGRADLFKTVSQRRAEFEGELRRMNDMRCAAAIVEGTWEMVLGSPPPESQLPPKVVFRSVIAWQQQFPRVHWWFLGSRR